MAICAGSYQTAWRLSLIHIVRHPHPLKFMRIMLLFTTRLFDVWGFVGGLIVVILFICFNKTVAGKSYIYPLIPFDPKECARRFLRVRVPHTYEEKKGEGGGK